MRELCDFSPLVKEEEYKSLSWTFPAVLVSAPPGHSVLLNVLLGVSFLVFV